MDALASEYGWTLDYIFNSLYLEEILLLLIKVRKRKNTEYMVLATIVQSPHTEKPSKIFEVLKDNDDEEKNDDGKAGLEVLRMALSKNPRFVVK